jgi:signal transduction histidine kinase
MTRAPSSRTLSERKLLKIADDERRRIGQELHDVMGQELAVLAFMSDALMEALQEHSFPELRLAETLKSRIKLLLHRVRTEAWGLIPTEIEAGELIAALSGLAKQISDGFNIECQFVCEQPVCVEKNVTATNLYRIAQEAVTNAIKHGHARHVIIQLNRNVDQITLQVEDDGTGLTEQAADSAGLGLRIMDFRAALINAELDIQHFNQGGVRVSCVVKGNVQ